MRISELANRTGTTPKTLRFYEDAGLIPEPRRAANGYRDYGPTVITRVQFIKAGQAVGLTLAEIRDILTIRDDGRAPCNAAIELLDTQLHDITQRIRELQAMKRDLTGLRERALDLDPADCAPGSVCHIINPGPCTCQAHTPHRAGSSR
jgi:DNA-binding transcriptional MerR regulator